MINVFLHRILLNEYNFNHVTVSIKLKGQLDLHINFGHTGNLIFVIRTICIFAPSIFRYICITTGIEQVSHPISPIVVAEQLYDQCKVETLPVLLSYHILSEYLIPFLL